ncbi:MAG: CPBP family intramembrane metalloprotease [Spirochaetota bacterium]|nr:MAG: CPBP family intramembrane metalloprotease [Spirochaetota bacterium]
MKSINIKKTVLFVILTYSFSWLLAGLFYAFGGKWNSPSAFIMAIGYMFIPMIAVFIVQKAVYKEALIKPYNITFKLNVWWLVAWLLPSVISFASMGVSLGFRDVSYSADLAGLVERFKTVLTPEQITQMELETAQARIHPLILSLIQGLAVGPTINAVAGFGEELGWRGFLQKELNAMGFYRSSIVTGAIWGLWHAPIILQGHNYPEHPIIGVFMMIVWCILLAPIFSYVRMKSKSVIAAAIIHGSLNSTAGLAIMVVKGGNDLLIGVTGFAGFIVLTALNALLFLHNRFLSKDPIN